MQKKLLSFILGCAVSQITFAADTVAKEELTPPAAAGALTADQIQPLGNPNLKKTTAPSTSTAPMPSGSSVAAPSSSIAAPASSVAAPTSSVPVPAASVGTPSATAPSEPQQQPIQQAPMVQPVNPPAN